MTVKKSKPPADAADEPDGGLSIHLSLEAPDVQPPLGGWLEPLLLRIATEAKVTEGVLSIVLVDDARMGKLHDQYMGDPSTTDVLTFDLREDADDPLEGDVVICIDEAARQAAARGHETRLEVLLYAVHGLMHLLGESDEDDASFKHMHAREDALLQAAGLGAVFSRPEAPRP